MAKIFRNPPLILLLFVFLLNTRGLFSQILYTESFVTLFDTTNRFKGNIFPSFETQKQKRELMDFKSTSDFAFRFKKNIFSFANKFELTKSGSNILLSGGFFYGEYRKTIDKKFMPEYYAQTQYDRVRGLESKYAGGINFRWNIFADSNTVFYWAIGPFYEKEKWTFSGVPNDRLPTDRSPITNELIKFSSYLSFKNIFWEKLKLHSAIYYQDFTEKPFKNPRIALNGILTYQITKNLAFGVNYQGLYDYSPVVPVDRYWYRFLSQIEINF